MKRINTIIISALALASCGLGNLVHAADYYTTNDDSMASSLYRAHEFSIDAFAMGSISEQTINDINEDRIRHDGRLGAGVGLNYFLSRHFGIGGDAFAQDFKSHIVDSTSGNLIFRIPIGETGFAPYLFGGGGYQFDRVEQSFVQGGAGLEFRFTHCMGIFTDARYVVPDKTDDYGIARVGVRWSF